MSLTYLAPYMYAKNGHRLYYGTTHWVKKVVVTREEKSVWYEIYDSELKKSFYIPSYNMRLIPDEELTLLSPEVPEADKFIHVDLATQMVTAFEGEKIALSVRCASGQRGTDTPKGEFFTYHKGPSIHMTNQGDAVTNVYNPPAPWCSFFTGAGHVSTEPTGTMIGAVRAVMAVSTCRQIFPNGSTAGQPRRPE